MWQTLNNKKITVLLKVLQDQLNDFSGLDFNSVGSLRVDHWDEGKV
jgi:hypothetical protein